MVMPGRCDVSRRMLAAPRSQIFTVVDVEVGQVNSRVELFDEIRRARRIEALPILCSAHGHSGTSQQAWTSTSLGYEPLTAKTSLSPHDSHRDRR